MAIKRKDFQKLSSTVQEFLLKLPDEEKSARLRDNLLQALHFLQLYYRELQNREKNTDPLQWNIDHSLSPLTPFREAPDKFEWDWINVDSQKVRQSLPRSTAESFKALPLIIIAVRDGDFGSVKAILKEDANCINECDSFSRDSVTYAVQFDQFDILKFLLKHGANVNNIASDGSTSLHRAAYKGNDQMLRILLEYGAYVNAQDSYNRSAMHWSTRNKNTNCLKVLTEYDANIHVKDRDGMSPAMWACHLDNYEHLKILTNFYENDSNEDCDNDGRTWLHWCVRKTDPLECLNTLLNPQSALIRDKEGKTCLHVAAEQGALDACKLIIEIGGRSLIHEKDSKKQTPLHLATLNGHARSIKLLIEFGADPYAKDAAGASPIDYVTKRQLHFCNSIIEICLRQNEKKSRQGFESSNSFNNNDYNLTPQPPTTPKSSYSRNQSSPLNTPTQSTSVPTFKETNYSNRPPRPFARSSKRNENGHSSVDPSIELIETNGNDGQVRNSSKQQNGYYPIPPSNGNSNSRSRPNFNGQRAGWTGGSNGGERENTLSVSSDRVPSALKASRASSRNSFASEDLERYMQPNKPVPPPRVTPVNTRQPSGTNRILSGRSQDSAFPHIYETPPPVKPRKLSTSKSNSYTNMNVENEDNQNHHDIINNNHAMHVEDVSEDENSVTSTKGEGYASEFSDSELKPGGHSKKHKKLSTQDLTKRPSTPMDIRQDQQVQQSQNQVPTQKNRHNERHSGSVKYQHIGEQQVSYRFNEWDPFGGKPINEVKTSQLTSNERQKSPIKQKHASREPSPRQSSGRGSLTSASLTQQNQDRISNDSSLDLVVSGQKFGRKESPTNTPREVAQLRPPTRRLQPIDRNSEGYNIAVENEPINSPKQVKNPENQRLKSKGSKSNLLDRKKLEPIRNQFGVIQNSNDNDLDKNSSSQYIEDEQSVSENTISSDKQQLNNVRVPKNKNSANQRQSYTGSKRRLIEALNTEESFKT